MSIVVAEHKDSFVQATNNSSIVSKRSVEKFYSPILYSHHQAYQLPNQKFQDPQNFQHSQQQNGPAYFEQFVPRFKRRSPVINRGYLLRLLIFKQSLEKIFADALARAAAAGASTTHYDRIYVVNLGCGFDPVAFEFLDELNYVDDDDDNGQVPILSEEIRKRLCFVDIDYHDMINERVRLINESEELQRILFGKDHKKQNTGIHRHLLNKRAKTEDSINKNGNNYNNNNNIYKIVTDNYIAVQCDLNDSDAYLQILKDLNLTSNNNGSSNNNNNIQLSSDALLAPVAKQKVLKVFIAEVSITYMDPAKSDLIIQHSLGGSIDNEDNDVHFMILEQHIPNEDFNDKFVAKMVKHFNNFNSPIKTVEYQYRTFEQQQERYHRLANLGRKASLLNKENGVLELVTLMRYWDDHISDSIKQQICKIEPFDEFEEFNLFCTHYYFGHYTNVKKQNFNKKTTSENYVSGSKSGTKDSAKDEYFTFLNEQKTRSKNGRAVINTNKSENKLKLSFQVQRKPQILQRRFVAACALPNGSQDKSVIVNSGFSQTKLNSTVLLSNTASQLDVSVDESSQQGGPSERLCHTLTNINYQCLLVGGRNAPNRTLSDCWILENVQTSNTSARGVKWRKTGNLPEPRSRHCAFTYDLPKNSKDSSRAASEVIVYGGTSDPQAAPFIKYDSITESWNELKIIYETSANDNNNGKDKFFFPTTPRFSAALVFDNQLGKGYIVGGMTNSELDIIDDAVYEFTIDDQISHISANGSGNIDKGIMVVRVKKLFSHGLLARYGAKLTFANHADNTLLLIGGVYNEAALEQDTTIIAINLQQRTVDRVWIDDVAWAKLPILVAGDLVELNNGGTSGKEVVYIGGGAVCYSFGSYWNDIVKISINLTPTGTGSSDEESGRVRQQHQSDVFFKHISLENALVGESSSRTLSKAAASAEFKQSEFAKSEANAKGKGKGKASNKSVVVPVHEVKKIRKFTDETETQKGKFPLVIQNDDTVALAYKLSYMNDAENLKKLAKKAATSNGNDVKVTDLSGCNTATTATITFEDAITKILSANVYIAKTEAGNSNKDKKNKKLASNSPQKYQVCIPLSSDSTEQLQINSLVNDITANSRDNTTKTKAAVHAISAKCTTPFIQPLELDNNQIGTFICQISSSVSSAGSSDSKSENNAKNINAETLVKLYPTAQTPLLSELLQLDQASAKNQAIDLFSKNPKLKINSDSRLLSVQDRADADTGAGPWITSLKFGELLYVPPGYSVAFKTLRGVGVSIWVE